ncbi:MAG: sulfotransferase [Propionibacteriales bacterium]|nr:sulfotransferase [Propionibacteriales bacterium]
MTMHNGEQPSEVFVLGSGRSGTTIVLHALACLDGVIAVPRLAGRAAWTAPLSSRMVRYGVGPSAWTRPSSESTALFTEAGLTQAFQSRVGRSIGPDDAGSLDMGVLWHRLQQIRHHGGARTAAVKNTASCGRVPVLADTFPDAAFVHVVRRPTTVVLSMLATDFWYDMTLWWDGRTTQRYAQDEDLSHERVAARHWARQVAIAMADLQRCAPSRAVQVQYEQFVDDPRGQLEQMQGVGLSMGTQSGLRRSLEDLGIKVESARRDIPGAVLAAVESECSEVAERWGVSL